MQETLRRVRVAPAQPPRAGVVGVDCEVHRGPGLHCGEAASGEGLSAAGPGLCAARLHGATQPRSRQSHGPDSHANTAAALLCAAAAVAAFRQ